MKEIRIYLDTSLINFVYAEDAPEKKAITIEFFEDYLKKGIYEVFISPVVIDEINKTKDEAKRDKLLRTIKNYNLKVLDITEVREEIERLAKLYIETKIIPERKVEDALHVAIATVSEVDILLSWNHRHLANVNKERKIMALNMLEGYTKPFKIITPMEVIYEEE